MFEAETPLDLSWVAVSGLNPPPLVVSRRLKPAEMRTIHALQLNSLSGQNLVVL